MRIQSDKHVNITFIGGGNMARALIGGMYQIHQTNEAILGPTKPLTDPIGDPLTFIGRVASEVQAVANRAAGKTT